MTPTECVAVVKFLAARCPAMRMHEQTPDAWYVDLVAHDHADAIEAVRRCSQRTSFVSLAELLTEITVVQRERTGRERVAQLEAQIAAENPDTPAAVQARPLLALLAGTPLKPMPRTERWPKPAIPVASKPPLTDTELAAAKAEMDAAVPACAGGRERAQHEAEQPGEVGCG